ncbi:MAG: bifunctional DNA-formamidopyrimidine glycosylase/DNA-(apurinic or apyrimidinic site) lyase [Fuerstiella sp.]
MPELPEVETMVRGLQPETEGREILQLEFCPCDRRPITVSPSPRTLRRRLTRRTIRRVRRLAKRVVIELNDDEYIVVEPRMTGLMLVSEPPTQQHRRLCWHLRPEHGRASSFEFWDRRGLGTVRLLNNIQMAELRQSLGPDALQLTAETWKIQLSRTSRPVKVAMLEQKLVAGIGNLYASEILHLAGISPRKSSRRLTKAEFHRIADATQHVLNEAIRYEGSTLADGTYRNALNKAGGYQNEHRVYQRSGEPCPTCRQAPIRRIVQAQRATFYCPACQRS